MWGILPLSGDSGRSGTHEAGPPAAARREAPRRRLSRHWRTAPIPEVPWHGGEVPGRRAERREGRAHRVSGARQRSGGVEK
jgi:hypothetical protein